MPRYTYFHAKTARIMDYFQLLSRSEKANANKAGATASCFRVMYRAPVFNLLPMIMFRLLYCSHHTHAAEVIMRSPI